MPATAPAKLCRLCKQDVTAGKRVKDANGNYYCQRCYEATPKQAAPAHTAAAPQPSVQLDDLLDPDAPMIDLSDLETPAPAAPSQPMAKAPTIARAPHAGTPSARPTGAPSAVCASCDTPLIPNRKRCVKCNKEVSQMDAIRARKAAAAKMDSTEVAGLWIARAIKVGLLVFVLGIVVFLGIGAYLTLHPGDPFDDYPTSRAQVVHDIFADISLGTDAGYEKAFHLVSRSARQMSNINEGTRYKSMYASIHNDFVSKYGPDWLNKMQIVCEEPGSSSEIVPYRVTINDNDYHLDVQAQMSVASAIENRMNRETYPENGKRHFGIYDIEEYSLLARNKADVDMQKLMRKMRADHPQ